MTEDNFSWMVNKIGYEHLAVEFREAIDTINSYNSDYFKLSVRFDKLVHVYKHLHTIKPLRLLFVRMYYIARYSYDIAVDKLVDNSIPVSTNDLHLSPSENSSDGS